MFAAHLNSTVVVQVVALFGHRRLPALRELWLMDTKLLDDSLSALAGVTQLEVLMLDGAPITDAGMAHVCRLTTLRRLGLGNTRITDAGLAVLYPLERLEWLRIDGAHVTDAALEAFRVAHPNCEIVR